MGAINLNYYRQLVDEKVSDAWHNMEQAEKAYRQAKATYESAMMEKDNFEKAIQETMDNVEKGMFINVLV